MRLQLFHVSERGSQRHLDVPLFGMEAPIQDSFFPHVKESDKHNTDVHQHFPKSEYLELILQNHRPRIKEDRLHIEQNEEHGDQIKLDRKTIARVSDGL